MSGEPSTATATPTPSTPPPPAKSAPDAERTLSRLRFWQALLVLIAAVLAFPLWPRQQTPPAAQTPERPVNIAVTVGNGSQNSPSPSPGSGAAPAQSMSAARPAGVSNALPRPTAPDATATPDDSGRSACDPRQSVRAVWLEARDLYRLGSWQRALERFACANSKLPRDVKAATDQRSLSAAFAIQNATLAEYGQLASEVQQLLEPARAALEQREW